MIFGQNMDFCHYYVYVNKITEFLDQDMSFRTQCTICHLRIEQKNVKVILASFFFTTLQRHKGRKGSRTASDDNMRCFSKVYHCN